MEILPSPIAPVGNAENSGYGDELEAKRQVFFDAVFAATRETPLERKRFTTCGVIDDYLLGSLVVEGLPGELRLPLSPSGAAALRSVSNQVYGQGLHMHIASNPFVARAWQLYDSKVSFPNNPHFLTRIEDIATRAVKELEPPNSLPVEARLSKVLFYETGGHFRDYDFSKIIGLFGTLVLQLPTHGGFEGGGLVVSHRRERKVFNCTEKASTRFYYTVFSADCEHFLEPVRGGRRLCLSFDLVRRKSGNVVRESNFETPLFRKVEDVLRPWLEEVDKEESKSKLYPTILAVPLQHEYTPANLSFAELKGEDANLCQVLMDCLERRLDIHLFVMTKTEMGTPAGSGEFPRGELTALWSDVAFRMGDVYNRRIDTSNWVGVDGYVAYAGHVDLKTEVALGSDDEPFYKYPNEFKYKYWAGNEVPSLDFFYHRVVVGIWPKSKAVATITESLSPNFSYFAVLSLLNMVERLHKEKDRHAPLVLRQLLAHCEKKYEGIWKTKGRDKEKAHCVSSRLLDMCVVAGDLKDTLRVLKLHSEVFQVEKCDSDRNPSHNTPWFIGLRNQFVCKSIAGGVHSHGCTACGAVLLLLQKDRLTAEGDYYAQLAAELQELGYPDESLLVAKKTMKLVLDSERGHERSYCDSQLLSTAVKILCLSEKCLKELSMEFSLWLVALDTASIILVLNEFYSSMLKPEVQRIGGQHYEMLFLLFTPFFSLVIERDFHSPVQEDLLVDLVLKIISLGDSQVFSSLIIRPLLHYANRRPQRHWLKELLALDLHTELRNYGQSDLGALREVVKFS